MQFSVIKIYFRYYYTWVYFYHLLFLLVLLFLCSIFVSHFFFLWLHQYFLKIFISPTTKCNVYTYTYIYVIYLYIFHISYFRDYCYNFKWLFIKIKSNLTSWSFSWKKHDINWAVITGYHRLGGLSNKNLFSPSSGGWKSRIRVPRLASSEDCLHSLQMADFLPHLHMAFPLGTWERDISGSGVLLIRTPVLWDWGPPSWPHLTLIIS